MRHWLIVLLASLSAAALLLGVYGLLDVSANGPAGATTPQDISQSPVDQAINPKIARSPGGLLYVAWSDKRNGHWDIFYTASSDGGATWVPPEVVYETTGESYNPSLVVVGPLPRVAWSDQLTPTDDLIYEIYQMDIGAGLPLTIPNTHHKLPYRVSLASGSNGDLHMAFSGADPPQTFLSVLYSRRPAGTEQWLTATVVFTATPPATNFEPVLAVSGDGSRLYLAWNRISLSDRAVMYTEGIVGTDQVTWTAPITLSGQYTLSWAVAIAAGSNGDVHVVWADNVGTGDQYQYLVYNRYDAGLGAWTGPARIGGPFLVNANAPYSLKPNVAVSPDDPDLVCITWNARPEDSTAEEVWLFCSEDGGATWPSGGENVSRSLDRLSINPALLISPDDNVHLVWQELVGGTGTSEYEIYYARRLPLTYYLPIIKRGNQ